MLCILFLFRRIKKMIMKVNKPKVVSFYLPQFHINKENNLFWGPGFTEWTNVAKAKPNFSGHNQPKIPRDLGFYDLSYTETIEKQVNLAKEYGVDCFCFYYYWFDGKRVLYKPLENFINSEIDFNFCICWANENWTKRWDGGNGEILLKQNYNDDFERDFIKSVKNILTDNRYLRKDNKPILIIYNPKHFHNPQQTIAKLKEEAIKQGVGDIEILVVDFFVGEDLAKQYLVDGIVEFPPHQFLGNTQIDDRFIPKDLDPKFSGMLYDYRKFIDVSINKWNDNSTELIRYRGIIPSWDNTARRQYTPHTVVFSNPDLFEGWFNYLYQYSLKYQLDFVFVNAWNEWGEGACLEPDLKDGLAYLEAIRNVKNTISTFDEAKIKLIHLVDESYKNTLESINTTSSNKTDEVVIEKIDCIKTKEVKEILKSYISGKIRKIFKQN